MNDSIPIEDSKMLKAQTQVGESSSLSLQFDHKSFGFFVFNSIVFSVVFLPLTIYHAIYNSNSGIRALSICLNIAGGFAALACWLFTYLLFTNLFAKNVGESASLYYYLLKREQLIRLFIPVSAALFFALVLIERSITGNCRKISSLRPMIDDWACNPYSEIKMIPMDTALILMAIPLLSSSLLKEKSVLNLFITWFIVLAGLVISAVITNSEKSIPIIVCYTIGSFMSLRENCFVQSSVGQSEKYLVKSSTVSDPPVGFKEKELRGMIANVAHDLKTVSFVLFYSFFFINCFTF
jgi:hypothetical protein